MAKLSVLTLKIYDDLSADLVKSDTPLWKPTNWSLKVVTDDGTNLEFVGVEKPTTE